MIPLLALSLITLILVLLYFFTMRRGALVNDSFMDRAEAMLKNKEYDQLSDYCDQQSHSISRVTQRTLDFMKDNPKASIDHLRDVAEAEGSRQAGIFTQRVSYLSDIGTIAPMVGLLGTVIGMIKSFFEIKQGHQEEVQQMELAAGVQEALITTAGGLTIGIIAFIFSSFFRGKVRSYITELEAAATHLLAILSVQKTPTIPPTSPAAPAYQQPARHIPQPPSEA